MTRALAALDMLKGAVLVAAFIGFLAIFATWVSLWDQTWRVAVEPTRASIYTARIGASPCLTSSWWWWRETGCCLI
jgi:hypothetical protein